MIIPGETWQNIDHLATVGATYFINDTGSRMYNGDVRKMGKKKKKERKEESMRDKGKIKPAALVAIKIQRAGENNHGQC